MSIYCYLDDGIVAIDLGGDQSEMLFLTRAEAMALAENLEPALIGTEGDEVVVADMPLAKRDARQLVDAIERVLGDAMAVRNGRPPDWRVVGF